MYQKGGAMVKAAVTLSSELYSILPFGTYKVSVIPRNGGIGPI